MTSTKPVPVEAVYVTVLQAAIQKIDEGQPDVARVLLADLLAKLKPALQERLKADRGKPRGR